MKKLIFLLCALILFAIPCYAETGDVVGKIYSTDIMTYVNGKLAEGYNIGGKTAIIIEDLYNKGYSIYHNYNDAERLLEVTATYYKNDMSSFEPEIERGKPGKVIGSIYETDIKVVLNGKEVKGYNLNGKTAILIEDIGTVTENPNASYGYSEYLCSFEWNGEERKVSLNFVEGYKIAVNTNPLAISIPLINFAARDNVLIPDYDPLNDFFSNVYSSEKSEAYLAETYVLKPLYFEIAGQKYEVGVCYTTEDGYDERFIKSPEYADSLLKSIVSEPMPAEEALSLFHDGINYETLDSLETEDFFFLVAEDKNAESNLNDIHYIAVKKTGGYAKINGSSTGYTERVLEKTDINKITVTVYPFQGTGRMRMEFDLNNYIFW